MVDAPAIRYAELRTAAATLWRGEPRFRRLVQAGAAASLVAAVSSVLGTPEHAAVRAPAYTGMPAGPPTAGTVATRAPGTGTPGQGDRPSLGAGIGDDRSPSSSGETVIAPEPGVDQPASQVLTPDDKQTDSSSSGSDAIAPSTSGDIEVRE